MFGKKFRQILLVVLVLFSASTSTHAQGILGMLKRRPEPTPPAVPELINQLQGADQARTRSHAADDLRQFDAKQFPEVVRALIYSLEHDANPSVRAEAAQSLARLRPITQAAGQALERAAANDSAFRVRVQAWSSLKSYQLAGYRNRGPGAIEDYISKAPANPVVNAPSTTQQPGSIFVNPPPAPKHTPVALPTEPVPLPTPAPNNLILTEPEPAQYNVPRPLPVGQPWSTAVPTPPRRITAPEIIDDAPNLTPPPPTRAPSPLDIP